MNYFRDQIRYGKTSARKNRSTWIVIGFFVLVIPLVTFIFGFKLGNKQQFVLLPPALITGRQEKQVGTVEATSSTVLVLSASENQTNVEPAVSSNEENLWYFTNQYREKNGLLALHLDQTICTLVEARLQQLETRGNLDSHDGFKATLEEYLKKGYRQIAENIATGFVTPQQVINEGWDKSLAHKALLLSSEMNQGCAKLQGSFAVFIAGQK